MGTWLDLEGLLSPLPAVTLIEEVAKKGIAWRLRWAREIEEKDWKCPLGKKRMSEKKEGGGGAKERREGRCKDRSTPLPLPLTASIIFLFSATTHFIVRHDLATIGWPRHGQSIVYYHCPLCKATNAVHEAWLRLLQYQLHPLHNLLAASVDTAFAFCITLIQSTPSHRCKLDYQRA